MNNVAHQRVTLTEWPIRVQHDENLRGQNKIIWENLKISVLIRKVINKPTINNTLK